MAKEYNIAIIVIFLVVALYLFSSNFQQETYSIGIKYYLNGEEVSQPKSRDLFGINPYPLFEATTENWAYNEIIFEVYGSNVGYTTTAEITGASPDSLENAFNSAQPLTVQSGESDKLLWTTAQPCPSGVSQCDTGEVCTGSPKTCKIPTNQFVSYSQPVTFSVEVSYDEKTSESSMQLNFPRVKFRLHQSSLEVAYTPNCDGNPLTRYIKTTDLQSSTGKCNAFLDSYIEVSCHLASKCYWGQKGGNYYICWDSGTGSDNYKYSQGGSIVSTSIAPVGGYETLCGVQEQAGQQSCGDGLITGTEVCDGTALASHTCQTEGYDTGTLSCSSNCLSFITTGCSNNPTQTCGNGIIEGTEVCDGSNLAGQTCQTKGFDTGTLSCSSNCLSFITTGCSNNPPANAVKFRTTDLSYGSGSSIAYTNNCGSSLTKLGYITSGLISSSTSISCFSKMPQSGYELVMSGLPGQLVSGAFELPSLWVLSSDSTRFRVCQAKDNIMYHKTFDSDTSGAVSSSSSSINPAYEKAC